MREKLSGSVGPVFFSDLRAHITRGAVIVVSPKLDLLEVGVALAEDDKPRVEEWVRTGLVTKPDLLLLERWSKIAGPAWTSLVVSPFVLVQERFAAMPS